MKIVEIQNEREIEQVSTIARRIWEEYFTPLIGEKQVQYMLTKFLSPTAISECMQNEQYRFFLLYEKEETIGFFALRPDANAMFLSKLYLCCTMRNKGYASIAMQEIEKISRESGYDQIWLTCNKHNGNSIAIYQHFGFSIFKEAISDIGQGYVMDDYFLHKNI